MQLLLALPTLLSLVRVVLTPLVVYFLVQSDASKATAVILFSVAAFTDFCDGFAARWLGAVSQVGSFLDPFADKLLTLSVFGSFYYHGLLAGWMFFLIMFREVFITILRVGQQVNGTTLSASLLGKAKTVMQFCTIYLLFYQLLLPVYNLPPSIWGLSLERVQPFFLYVMLLLTMLSGGAYITISFASWFSSTKQKATK